MVDKIQVINVNDSKKIKIFKSVVIYFMHWQIQFKSFDQYAVSSLNKHIFEVFNAVKFLEC